MDSVQCIIISILCFPFIGFILNAFLGHRFSKKISGFIGVSTVLASFGFTIFYIINHQELQPIHFDILSWINIGDLHIPLSVYIDRLTVLMMLIITGVGSLIHIYSVGYMQDDEGFSRYFSYLNLFICFMLILVMAGNYLGMFIGWEGVGLCSYLLIGFWYDNQNYNDAAKKAFIMNRIGDLGFLLGIFFLLFIFHSLEFGDIQKGILHNELATTGTITLICILLFIGATGKSAQIPLFTWLPDAMAGPTPVSALIHAATMVTAGIYMIVRSNFLYSLSPVALQIIAIVGISTALVGATIGLKQTDIKKVLAYSTVSQLGLMFLALGVGAYTTALFHVMTHAFFKALLFLGSGSVIHALHGEQDIRRMGGLKKFMPITFATFLIGSLAISGVPPFAGFFSKDEIMVKAYESNLLLWILGMLTSAMTAFYMFRLLFVTFSGNFRGSEKQKSHLHESPSVITIPLIILAILSIIGGWIGLPEFLGFHNYFHAYLSPIIVKQQHETAHITHQTETILMALAIMAALGSIILAYVMYVKKAIVPQEEIDTKGLQKFLLKKWYWDEVYDYLIIKPYRKASQVLQVLVDEVIIDGIVVQGSAKVVSFAGGFVRMLQNGQVSYYLLLMTLSIGALFAYIYYKIL